eukprot:CAMPEP_0116931808 /NCGR_PEP_ID=MMETSP0467-20121206/28039_1 /TAXON_ID=283647 /ORGANISM="Mesodinium pulex, Strain SPMC105" /LENGTH=70 /DNA_ID=CAMNT_0004612323 /DNA_START=58 /DNA_END=270 /DNA_ORIENTATION=-
MTSGTIGQWNVEKGSQIMPGNIIASIETDKAAVDFESTDEFKIVQILYPEGTSDLEVNTVIAIGADDDEE